MIDLKYITDTQRDFLNYVMDRCKMSKKEVQHVQAVLNVGSYWRNRDRAETMNKLRTKYLNTYQNWISWGKPEPSKLIR